jgi:uncharacterized protein (DUF58 family)
MAKQRIIYFLALVGCVVFYMAYQLWFSWVLLQVIVLVPLLSLLLSLAAIFTLRMNLELEPVMPMGRAERMQLNVSSKLPLPPYKCKVRITKPLTGENWRLKPDAEFPADHCGKYYVELYKPRTCDYLGLFRFKVRKAARQIVLVWPNPVEVEIPPELNRHLMQHWQPKPGGFAENYEIRQFHPGDNLNRIHWKLSAKVDDLMLREPIEPVRGLILLTMDLNGTATELDIKLGRLLWLGRWLLEREVTFDLRVLTANGIEGWTIRDEEKLDKCIKKLFSKPVAKGGSIREQGFNASWRYHIGGEQNEG